MRSLFPHMQVHMKVKRLKRTAFQRNLIAAAQGWQCAVCQCMLPASYTIDHIMPLGDGGSDVESNCQALCHACHGSKTALENHKRARASDSAFAYLELFRFCRTQSITSTRFAAASKT